MTNARLFFRKLFFDSSSSPKDRLRSISDAKELYTSANEIEDAYARVDREVKKLVLGVTSGRSGMKWVYEIFRHHHNAEGGGERNVEAESFYRYIKYHKLPIDTKGILAVTKREILLDWIKADMSITVSPYFSNDFIGIVDELKVDRVIWGITDPEFTVTSFYNKGIYSDEICYGDQSLATGYQPERGQRWSHFMGRIIPSGEFYHEWESLTRVGKISWFLNWINKEIYTQTRKLPDKMLWVFDLREADQNYEYYLSMAKSFGLQPILSKRKFLNLKKLAAKKSENITKIWTSKEHDEFEKYAVDYLKIYKELTEKAIP